MVTIKRKVLEVYCFPGTHKGYIYEIKEVDDLDKVKLSYQVEFFDSNTLTDKVSNFSCLSVLFLFGYQNQEKFYFVPVNDNNELIS